MLRTANYSLSRTDGVLRNKNPKNKSAKDKTEGVMSKTPNVDSQISIDDAYRNTGHILFKGRTQSTKIILISLHSNTANTLPSKNFNSNSEEIENDQQH